MVTTIGPKTTNVSQKSGKKCFFLMFFVYLVFENGPMSSAGRSKLARSQLARSETRAYLGGTGRAR